MTNIDERVVALKFDNAQFEKGVKETQNTLKGLGDTLDMGGLSKNMSGLGGLLDKMGLGGIASGIDTISSKFNVLGAVGFSVIQNLTNTALNFGKKIAGAVLDPIVEGGKKRALNIEQAKFQFKGLGMDVEASMAAANEAVLGTAFGLDEAAVVAAQFGASGMQAGDEMTSALRGISGVAAMAGSSYSDVGRIFTKVAGQGRLMGDDLLSLGARGVNAAATLADAMGISEQEVREMVTKGEISFQEFADAMSDAFGEHATKANETFSGSLSNLNSALARIGADFATAHFENLRRIINAATPVVDAFKAALEPVIDLFIESSGLKVDGIVGWLEGLDLSGFAGMMVPVSEGLGNIVDFLSTITTSFIGAFSEVFPAPTADTLLSIGEAFKAITENFKMGEESASNLKSTFAGFFAILGIGWEILKGLLGAVISVFTSIGLGSGSVLTLTGSIGDFLVSLHAAIRDGNVFGKIFGTIGKVIGKVIEVIFSAVDGVVALGKTIGSFFSGGLDFSFLNGFVDGLKARFEPLAGVIDWVKEQISKLWGILFPKKPPAGSGGGGGGGGTNPVQTFIDQIKGIHEQLEPFLEDIGRILTSAFQNFDFSTIFDGINTGIFAGIGIMLMRFFKGSSGDSSIDFSLDFGLKDLATTVSGSIDQLTESLKVMQGAVKAATLLQIAIALGILAAALFTISLIDSEKLTTSLIAIGIMLAQLLSSMELMTKITSGKDLGEIITLTAALILLGIALNIMASAVKKLAELDWNGLAKGLVGVLVLLGAMVGVGKLMQGQTKSIIGVGLGLVLVAIGIRILVGAVTNLAGLSWEELAKGLLGVIVLMGLIGGLSKVIKPKDTVGAALGMVIVGGALILLGMALKKFSDIPWDQMQTGMVGLAAVLGLVVGAIHLMPKNTPILALSLVGIGQALNEFAKSMQTFGGMSWEEIAKASTMFAASMGILVAALNLMPGGIAGAAALVIASAALWILAPVLVMLGEMSWNEIAKASVMLLAALALIAAGMYVMSGAIVGAATMLVAVAALWVLVPLLVALGEMSWNEIAKASVMLFAALALIAAGMYVMTGAIVGAAALVVVALALQVLAPVLLLLSTLSWAGLLVGLAALAGVFLVLGVAGLLLAPVVPFIMLLAGAIILMGVGAMAAGAGMFLFATGFAALGIAAATAGPALVQLFKDMLALIPYAMEQIGLGIIALANTIREGAPAIAQAMVAVLMAIIAAIMQVAPQIVGTLIQLVGMMVSALLNNVPKLVQSGLELLLGILRGIRDNIQQIVEVAGEIIVNFINGISNQLPDIVESGYNLIITFVESLADTISNNQQRMDEAGQKLAKAIVDGMISGLGNGVKAITDKAKEVAGGALDGAMKALGINSPSKEFMKIGRGSAEGMVIGLAQYAGRVEKASANVGKDAMSSLKNSLSGMSDMVNSEMDTNPTIRPVLDLSDVRKNAGGINSMFSDPSLNLDGTRGRANYIAQARSRSENSDISENSSAQTAPVTPIQFIQHNNSPRALSEVEIYRNTNNQLSAARGVLKP